MGDSYGDNQKGRNFEGSRDNRGSFKGGRGRESGGGFRIRLSDNEMRAVRSIQETFNLRSTVAVLGFAIRTLAQMLEEGKLDNLIAEYRSQSSQNDFGKDQSGRKNQSNINHQKPNPFARPSKPDSTSTQTTQIEAEESQNKEKQTDLNEGNDSEKNEQDSTSN